MVKRKSVITNKFRFTMFLTIVFVILTLLINGILNIVNASFPTYEDYEKVLVREGDTLWEIAKENNRYNQDIRKVIYEIKKVNKIDDSYLMPGDVIKIPNK
mgnify:CR=1 FL=1